VIRRDHHGEAATSAGGDLGYRVGRMKIGLVGMPGSGKSTVFGALTGIQVETGYAARGGKANIGVVKVPDPRIDALAALYRPKKVVYAEATFTDLGGGEGGLDRAALNAMRNVDALCQVLRAFDDGSGDPSNPLGELVDLATETVLADLEIVEQRVARLAKDRSNPTELDLLRRIQAHLEDERPIRAVELRPEERKQLSPYSFLTLKPLLLVLNTSEEAIADPAPEDVAAEAGRRGLGLIVLSAKVEMDIAQMSAGEQKEFLEALGLEESARDRFVREAYGLLGLISMLTAGEDECRAWPVPQGSPAPQAAGKIHSDIERGFIRAEVVPWQDLVELGSEAKCREAAKLRVEGKAYQIQDGDVVNFRFNV
jgi:GTP-binding protein YchF